VPDDRRVLEGIERVVIDGTNVLHALRRSAVPLPATALIGRLRAIVPPQVGVTLLLDGSPEHGLVSRKISSGIEVMYSGRISADDLITRIVERNPTDRSAGLLVVTDDIALGARVRRAHAQTIGVAWLIERLDRQRLSSPSAGKPSAPSPAVGIGGGRGGHSGGAPAGAGAEAGTDEELSEGPRWAPGRGATRKVGNGRRRPSTGR
jgi:hypothetical protein